MLRRNKKASRALADQRPTSERQPSAHLEDALGACSRGDLSVVARREACGGVGETHQVEDIRGLAAELEHNPTLELNVAEEPHVDIFEPRPIEAVAAHVAVRATGPDAPCDAGPIGSKSCRIEPLTGHAVGGANPAAVWAEHGD